SRQLANLGRADGNHRQVFVDAQLIELIRRKTIGDVGEGGQAQVGLVDAVLAHGFVKVHALEGRFDLVPGGFESRGKKALDHFPNAFGLRVGHFQIDLGEFGLAVGAQIFVAEAAHDLEILIEARDHQDLLEQLRRLRQGVEHSRLDAAGDEIVARAFGRGAGHERGFDFEEALRGEIVADGQRHFMPQFDVELHSVAAQVDVTIFQAHLFVRQHRVRGQKGQRLRYVQNAQFFHYQFDFAGRNIGVNGIGIAALDLSYGRDHELVAQGFRLFVHGGIEFVVEDHLGYAGAVAQVDEDDLAEVAAAVDPSHEHNFLACIGESKLPAHMSSPEVA